MLRKIEEEVMYKLSKENTSAAHHDEDLPDPDAEDSGDDDEEDS